MASGRRFVNNFSTTLSANITNVQTTIPLQAGDGALLPQVNQPFPFPPFVEEDFMLTIDDGAGTVEVVRVVDHDGSDTIDEVERGQEGTTAVAFSSGDTVEARNTEGTMAQLFQFSPRSEGLTAKGENAIEMITGRGSFADFAGGSQCIAIGREVSVNSDKNNSIVIGQFARVVSPGSLDNCIMIGEFNQNNDSDGNVLIGHDMTLGSSGTFCNFSVSVGHDLEIRSNRSVLIGSDLITNGDDCIFIGTQSFDFKSLDSTRRAIMIGHGWANGVFNDTTNTVANVGGLVMGFADDGLDDPIPGMARIIYPRCPGFRIELEDGTTEKPSYSSNGYEATLFTRFFDGHVSLPFPQTRSFFTWQLPDEVFIYPNEIGVIFDLVQGSPASVSTDMVIDVGSTGQDSTDILNAQTVTVGAVPNNRERFRFAPAVAVRDQGFNAITFTLDTPIAFNTGGFGCFAYVKGEIYMGF